MKLNFRQFVGVSAVILGIVSIISYMLLTGENYFVGLIPGRELIIIFEYLFLITGSVHMVNMIKDNRKSQTGLISLIVYLLMLFVAINLTPSTGGREFSTLVVVSQMVIFFGWGVIVFFDSIIVSILNWHNRNN